VEENRLVERVVDGVALLSRDIFEDVGFLNDIGDLTLPEAEGQEFSEMKGSEGSWGPAWRHGFRKPDTRSACEAPPP